MTGVKKTSTGRVVVTVEGIDQVGIVAHVTRALADAHANIVDISQKVLAGDLFVMVAVVELFAHGAPFETLRERLTELGKEIGVEIRVQREELFRAMHRI